MIAVVCEDVRRNRDEIASALALANSDRAVEWFTTAELEKVPLPELDQFCGFFFGSGDYERPDAAIGAIRFARERGVPLVGT